MSQFDIDFQRSERDDMATLEKEQPEEEITPEVSEEVSARYDYAPKTKELEEAEEHTLKIPKAQVGFGQFFFQNF